MKDIIIIGSGLGGLVTGNLLAKKGHKVTIFESHNMPGGYTAGFYRKGFYFESGTLSFESKPTVFKAMRDIGVEEKIEFVEQKTRLLSEKLDRVPNSIEDFKDMLYSAYPSQKESLNKFFEEVDTMNKGLNISDEPIPYLYSGVHFLKALLPYVTKGPKAMKVIKEYGDLTTTELIERFFEKDSELFNLVSGLGYPDMSAVFIGSALLSVFNDYWTVKGGMQSWANVLAENFKSLGGELKLNSYVSKIITRDGAAVGVFCNGVEYSADCVIAACDYKKTFLKLLDNPSLIHSQVQEKIKNSPVSEGIFTVYLGLSLPKEELEKCMLVPHVMYYDVKPGYDIYNSEDEEFFKKTGVSIYSPSMINPNHAPNNKSSLMIQAAVPYKWMNNWGNGDREKYKQLKSLAMEEMINKVSKIIPNLQDSIEYKDAATPLTYERFTHNTDGATSAWSWNPKKKFYDNISSGIKVDTPVKNLYIGSCWAMEIGGVPGAITAAYQCANKVEKW